MELKQALVLLDQVCANFMGKLSDHQALQQAMQAVKQACEPQPKIEEAPKSE